MLIHSRRGCTGYGSMTNTGHRVLEHELWLNVVAANISFDALDDNGTRTGLGHVWSAAVHGIDFPAQAAIFEALASWLENEVASTFEMSMKRLR